MKSKFNEQKVRDRILSDGYGKFDLVEDIFTKEEILSVKPRIVFKNITERLSIPKDQINSKTFWSWLRRYRRTYKPACDLHHEKPIMEPGGSFPIRNRDEEWVKNFKPSIPKGVEREPVVIKVIRSDNNSQNNNQQ